MNTLLNTYNQRIETHRSLAGTLQKKLFASSMFRLVVFVAGAFAVYFLWQYWQVAVGIAIGTFALFLFLVSRHENLKQKRNYHRAMVAINEREIQVLQGDFHNLPDGAEFLTDDHEYSRDIDLFGKGSFFQYLNRSVTKDGVITLSRKLTNNNPTAIPEKQEAVKELATKLDFRQTYAATATLLDNDKEPKQMLKWIEDYTSFVPAIYKWLPWAFFAVSIGIVVLYFNDLINGWFIAGIFFLGLAITRHFLKRINEFSINISKLELFFQQYSKLILSIEKEEFTSELLVDFKNQILTTGNAASSRLAQLASAIGRLDQRNNMLFGILANGLGLWDLKQVHTIEQWLGENKSHVRNWLETAAQIDAMNSLGNYAYNHPEYLFPTISDGDFKLQATNVKHPLLDPQKAIGNDINIESGEFFIITGANMAGKSTFLRTVSMTIVMSNAGLPIWCDEVSYSPIQLITSMRTSDSLTDDESYFFSELKRLKYIVDKIENDRYFIVLDEILKGTNSQDKANGSRKLLEKLSLKHATGIIATHDLSLTEVAKEYDTISNYFFDADITNDVLTFDYKFKDGVATNMNASFLLRKMGIVDE